MKRICLLCLVLIGCMANHELYATKTYGGMACPANEIVISHREEKFETGSTWRAECRGKTYVCRWGVNERHAVCAEEKNGSRKP